MLLMKCLYSQYNNKYLVLHTAVYSMRFAFKQKSKLLAISIEISVY